MTFTESNTVEAHLRDLLAGAASARPAQLSIGLARAGSKIAGLGWHYVAPADLPASRKRCWSNPICATP